MKSAFKSFLFAALAWLLAVPALAADPFTVAGVPVDARASSAIQAQSDAIADGQLRAARALLERLTLEDERLAKGLPALTPEIVGPMIRGLSVNNERRSATRYLGDVSIAFNPSAVQQLLRGAGLTMVSSQAQPRVVLASGTLPTTLEAQLRSGRFAHALTPLELPPGGDVYALAGAYSSQDMQEVLNLSGGNTALVVEGAPGAYRASEISLSSQGPVQSNSYNFGSFEQLVARLEADFKQTAAVPSGQATTATASVLYSGLPEWQRLQRAINTSAQVRDARLDAVSKDGALMTLSFGDFARLQSEMRQKGVTVEQDPQLGLVIRR